MKPVLIIESSKAGLKVNEEAQKEKDTRRKYILEGVFTEFDIENRNNRTYTASEFLPHLDEMMSKQEWSVVYGEMDHPESFDLSMKCVSHIIEKAFYNKEKNRVDGEIRLLSTKWGQNAKAIVDDGCPLFVSSRAAGITESNGLVKLKKLFTYDIVADPGFSSARMNMKIINESFGFSNEDRGRKIIELPKDKEESFIKSFDLSNDSKTNELFNMNNNDYVTQKHLSEYSKYLTKEIGKIKTDINSQISESNKSGKIKTDVEKLLEYYDNLQTQNNNVIKYLDYIAEKVSISINTSTKLEEKTNKLADYSNYLAENLDKSIDYSNYIAENLDKNIDYSNYLAENLDKSIDYSNYIAENLDANIGFSEYLAENVDANIAYSQYIAEGLNTSISYSEYVAECADRFMGYANIISEKLNNGNDSIKLPLAKDYLINEGKKSKIEKKSDEKKEDKKDKKIEVKKTEVENKDKTVEKEKKGKEKGKEECETAMAENLYLDTTSNNKESITSKIDKLIEEAKKREASKDQKPAFYAYLKPQDIEAFEALTNEDQEKAKVSLNESIGFYNRHEVLTIIKNAVEKEKQSPEEAVLLAMPEEVKPLWESLNRKEQSSFLAQSKFYDLSTKELREHFWTTRKFTDVKPLNEANKALINYTPITNDKFSDSQIEAITNRFKGIR